MLHRTEPHTGPLALFLFLSLCSITSLSPPPLSLRRGGRSLFSFLPCASRRKHTFTSHASASSGGSGHSGTRRRRKRTGSGAGVNGSARTDSGAGGAANGGRSGDSGDSGDAETRTTVGCGEATSSNTGENSTGTAAGCGSGVSGSGTVRMPRTAAALHGVRVVCGELALGGVPRGRRRRLRLRQRLHRLQQRRLQQRPGPRAEHWQVRRSVRLLARSGLALGGLARALAAPALVDERDRAQLHRGSSLFVRRKPKRPGR